MYGGGYVLIAFLRDGLEHQWHWLTEAQLLDAIAVGQFTPGPLFTTATFVGYLTGGVTGASIATVAIFLPSFILIAISGPLVPLSRRFRLAGAFFDGVNVSALALMATGHRPAGKSRAGGWIYLCHRAGRHRVADSLQDQRCLADWRGRGLWDDHSAWLPSLIQIGWSTHIVEGVERASEPGRQS